MLGHVGDGRTLDPSGRVVPADGAACRMLAGVEAIAGLRREVDSADEGDAIIDHDRLLVVTVQRAFLRVEAALDPGLLGEGVAHPRDLAPRRPEQRQRRSGPHEQADVDALRKFGEQVPQHDGPLTAAERKVRREEPAGDVYVRAGGLQLARDHRQRLAPVDQDVDRITRSRRRLAHGPAGSFTVERVLPAEPAKPPPMVAADLFGDRFAQHALCG